MDIKTGFLQQYNHETGELRYLPVLYVDNLFTTIHDDELDLTCDTKEEAIEDAQYYADSLRRNMEK